MPRGMKQKERRKPYKAPAVRTERVYERKSLACGKNTGDTPSCIADFQVS